MMYTAQITIMPLAELLDPQGKAVNEALHNLSLQSIKDVRIGKHINLAIDAPNQEAAFEIADIACKKILYNAVMESYTIKIVE